MQDTELFDLISRQEPLRRELQRHVFQPVNGAFGIHHPYVIDLFVDLDRCGRVNKAFEYKREAVKQALKEKNYRLYVWLHERPYRLAAFFKIRDTVSCRKYWEMLGEIWSDSENIYQHTRRWRSLLLSVKAGSQYFMNGDERKAFKKLPDTIEIHRGYSCHLKMGLSWTLDHSKAIWFARRFPADRAPTVLSGKILKQDCFGYLSERDEKEIIVLDAKKIRNVKIQELERKR